MRPGSVFAGDYRVVRPLSSGGMGDVFVVEQLSTGKQRALKLMHRELVSDPASRQRFEQEARVGSRIASEHIVEVQAAGVDASTRMPYLVMELLSGEDLGTRLARGPLPLAEAAQILEQLCHALGAAHDAGVVHRDLKPDNVFLSTSKRVGVPLVVKILDFGIAKVTEGQRHTTGAYGTPLWLAPEQTQRGVITPAADVWALGLLVFTMLTGRIFWRAGETQDITGLISEILNEPIPQASARAVQLGRSVPAGFDTWFARCLSRDPNTRYANGRAAWAALEPVVRGSVHFVVSPTRGSTHDAQFGATQAVGLPMQTAQPVRQSSAAPTLGHTPYPMAATGPPPQKKKGSGGCLLALFAVATLAVGLVAVGYVFVRPRVMAALEPTPSPSPSPTPTPSPSPTPTPTSEDDTDFQIPEIASGMPFPMVVPSGDGVGGMVTSSDTSLQADAQTQFNGDLKTKFDACLVKHPNNRAGQFVHIIAQVNADGSVQSAQTFSGLAGPAVQCMLDAVKAAHFAKPKRKTDLSFSIIWMK